MNENYGNYPDLSKVKKVLIIKLRHLGDVLLSTPLFSIVKKYIPQAQIDAYIYKESYPILEGNSAISEIISYDREIKKKNLIKRLSYEIKLLKKIKGKKYDLVLNLTEGDRGCIATDASHALYRVGYDIKTKFNKNKIKYSHIVKNCPSQRHMVERHLDFLRKIGISPGEEEKQLYIDIPDDTYQKIDKMLKKNDMEKFILIHPSSRWRFKCYPVNKMKNLAKLLLQKGFKLAFTSGKEEFERKMIEEIVKDLPREKILDLSAQVSIKELAALVSRSYLLLCVDSLPFHIASALKAKCIVLFGPTNDKMWGPWQNENAKVIAADYICRPCFLDGCGGSKISDCINSIKEQDILKEIEKLS